MADSGGNLREMLAAGEWATPRFAGYLDLDKIETAGVVEAHLAESDDDEERCFS